jgi:hypothetical protein
MAFRVKIYAIDSIEDLLDKKPNKEFECNTLEDAILIHLGYHVFPHRVIIYSSDGSVIKDEIYKKATS